MAEAVAAEVGSVLQRWIIRGGNGAKKRLSLEIYFLVVRYFRLE